MLFHCPLTKSTRPETEASLNLSTWLELKRRRSFFGNSTHQCRLYFLPAITSTRCPLMVSPPVARLSQLVTKAHLIATQSVLTKRRRNVTAGGVPTYGRPAESLHGVAYHDERIRDNGGSRWQPCPRPNTLLSQPQRTGPEDQGTSGGIIDVIILSAITRHHAESRAFKGSQEITLRRHDFPELYSEMKLFAFKTLMFFKLVQR